MTRKAYTDSVLPNASGQSLPAGFAEKMQGNERVQSITSITPELAKNLSQNVAYLGGDAAPSHIKQEMVQILNEQGLTPDDASIEVINKALERAYEKHTPADASALPIDMQAFDALQDMIHARLTGETNNIRIAKNEVEGCERELMKEYGQDPRNAHVLTAYTLAKEIAFGNHAFTIEEIRERLEKFGKISGGVVM